MKTKKQTLILSVMIIAICLSLVVGSTLALFSSKSDVNIAVTSGTVDVKAIAGDLTLYSNGVEQTGGAFEVGGTATKTGNEIIIERMVSNDAISFDIVIENYSDITIKYRTVIKSSEDTGLASKLKITFTENENYQTFSNSSTYYTDWETLSPSDIDVATADTVKTVNVKIELPEGVEVDGSSCKLVISVEAVQGNADVKDPITPDEDNSVYYINSKEGMMLVQSIINNAAEGETINLALASDIDMAGCEWIPLDMNNIVFDGRGYTVSNLNCELDSLGRSGFIGYLGAATVKDLTLKNVNACGNQAGTFAAVCDGGKIANVTISGINTVEYENINSTVTQNAVGAIIGLTYNIDSESSVLIAEGASVTVNYQNIVTEVTDYANKYSFKGDISAYVTDNGTVAADGNRYYPVADGVVVDDDNNYAVNTPYGLEYLNENWRDLSAKTINLLSDIDFEGYTWSPLDTVGTNFAGINGNGHTISNMTISGQGMFTRFASTADIVTVSDITFDNATVNSTALNTSILCVQTYDNTLLDNVKVVNSSFVGKYKVAPLIATVYDENAESTITLTVRDCVVENCTVTATSIEFMVCGMVAFVYEEDNDKIVFEGSCRVSDVILYSPDDDYDAHAAIYCNNGSAEGSVNTAENVTVENVTFVPLANTVEITPTTDLSSLTFESDCTYLVTGDFSGGILNMCIPAGLEDVIIDGDSASNIGELLIRNSETILDNYSTISGVEKSGSYTVKNFVGAKQISVFAYNTTVEILENTTEFLSVYGGNLVLDISGNTVDANFTKHNITNPGNGSVWTSSEYAVYMAICDYTLTFNNNVVTDAISHAVGINGNQTTFAGCGASNNIASFVGNNITVNSETKTGRAALKIWDDAVYAPSDSQSTQTEAAIDFVNAYKAQNVFVLGNGQIYFQFYSVNISE